MVVEKPVLIADDEAEICLLIAAIIRRKHMKPVSVHTIADAKRAVETVEPKILFLDINLPDGNGLDLLSQLKITHPEIRIIIISAFDSFKEKALNIGADIFLSKPFDQASVIAALNGSA